MIDLQYTMAQVDNAAGRSQWAWSRDYESHSRKYIFHGKDFISSKTQLTMLPRLAYGLG